MHEKPDEFRKKMCPKLRVYFIKIGEHIAEKKETPFSCHIKYISENPKQNIS